MPKRRARSRPPGMSKATFPLPGDALASATVPWIRKGSREQSGRSREWRTRTSLSLGTLAHHSSPRHSPLLNSREWMEEEEEEEEGECSSLCTT